MGHPAIDKGPLTAAQQALVDEHVHLAIITAKTFARPRNTDYGNYVADAFEGLRDAARRYKPELGVKFASYAKTRMLGEILDSMRREYGRSGQKSFTRQLPPMLTEEGEPSGFDIFEAPVFHDDQMPAWWFEKLNDRDRQIVMLRVKGLSMKQIGATIDRSECLVSTLLKSLRVRIAGYLQIEPISKVGQSAA